MNRRDFLKTLGVGAVAVQLPGAFIKHGQTERLNTPRNKNILSVYLKSTAICIGGADQFMITKEVAQNKNDYLWIIESDYFYFTPPENSIWKDTGWNQLLTKPFWEPPVYIVISDNKYLYTGDGFIYTITINTEKMNPISIEIKSDSNLIRSEDWVYKACEKHRRLLNNEPSRLL